MVKMWVDERRKLLIEKEGKLIWKFTIEHLICYDILITPINFYIMYWIQNFFYFGLYLLKIVAKGIGISLSNFPDPNLHNFNQLLNFYGAPWLQLRANQLLSLLWLLKMKILKWKLLGKKEA